MWNKYLFIENGFYNKINDMKNNFITTAIKHTTLEGKGYFRHFGIRPVVCCLYGDDPKDIIQVKCTISKDQTEHKPPDYWGWYNLQKNEWETGGLLQPSHIQFSMCFPYGYPAEEKSGKGKAYRLDVKEIKNKSNKF